MSGPLPTDPGALLRTHRAPEGMVTGALARHRAPRRGPWVPLVALAAGTLIGVGLGWAAHPDAGPVVVDAPTHLVAASAVPVRLLLHAPEAQSVAVAGTFTRWAPAALTRTDDGTWFTTVPVERGHHEYVFVIDGTRWVADPTAPLTTPDDFGQANAILDV